MTITIKVQGMPGAQGSKVSTKWGGMKESSKRVAPWRAAVAYYSEKQYKGQVITDPVSCEIEFVLPRGKSHYGTGCNAEKLKASAPQHCTNGQLGDIDKLARSTLDGLAVRSGGCVLADDRLVVELSLRKRYAKLHEPSGALVRVLVLR